MVINQNDMRRIMTMTIVLVGLIFLNGCSSNPPKGRTQFMGLNGNVKSVTERTYRIANMDGVLVQREMSEDGYKMWMFDTIGDVVESYTWEYGQDYHRVLTKTIRQKDSVGRLINEKLYNSKGLAQETAWGYDEDGNISMVDESDYDQGITKHITCNTTLTDKGKVVEEISTSKDKKGNVLEEYRRVSNIQDSMVVLRVTYDTNGEIESEEQFEYDSKNVIKKSKATYKGGNWMEYSNNKSKMYSEDGSLTYKVESRYKNNVQTITYTNYYKKEVSGRTVAEYRYYPQSDIWLEIESVEDDYDDGVIKETLKTTHKYQFDNQGNWIICMVYTNNKPSHIIYREIEYYSQGTNVQIENDDIPNITGVGNQLEYQIYVDKRFNKNRTASAHVKKTPLHKLILDGKGEMTYKDKQAFFNLVMSDASTTELNEYVEPRWNKDVSNCIVTSAESDLAKLYYLYDERGFIAYNRPYYDDAKAELIGTEKRIMQTIQDIDSKQNKY